MDFVIREASKRKLYIGRLPTWGDKVAHLWGEGPTVFNEKNAYAYAKKLAERYKDQWNIIWILGGDRPGFYERNGKSHDDRPVWRAMAKGIQEVCGKDVFITYHPGGSADGSSKFFHNEKPKLCWEHNGCNTQKTVFYFTCKPIHFYRYAAKLLDFYSYIYISINKQSHMVQIFTPEGAQQVIDRIDKLTPETKPHWGRMNAAQMLAHCNVTYELVYTDQHPKPKNPFMRWVLKSFVKNTVVNEEPYKKNMRTAPHFIMENERNFEKEKQRLIGHIRQTQELGADHFEGKESHSFGVLNKTEWNNMFAKHLDHHLSQFGV